MRRMSDNRFQCPIMKTDYFGRNLQEVFLCENVDIVVSAEIEMPIPRDIGLVLSPTGLK